MPRTVSLVVLAVLTLVACFLNAFAQIEWFATAAGVTGFAFGGIQGIVPALASEIFGLRYLATNYSMLQVGPALCERALDKPSLVKCCSSPPTRKGLVYLTWLGIFHPAHSSLQLCQDLCWRKDA